MCKSVFDPVDVSILAVIYRNFTLPTLLKLDWFKGQSEMKSWYLHVLPSNWRVSRKLSVPWSRLPHLRCGFQSHPCNARYRCNKPALPGRIPEQKWPRQLLWLRPTNWSGYSQRPRLPNPGLHNDHIDTYWYILVHIDTYYIIYWVAVINLIHILKKMCS